MSTTSKPIVEVEAVSSGSAVSGSGTSSNLNRRPRRRTRSPPPLPLIRDTIAKGMTQIMVNMVNVEYKQRCRELLQLENLEEAHDKILHMLEAIDIKTEHRLEKQRQRHNNNKHNNQQN